MACCLLGHDSALPVQQAVEAPPCHGEMEPTSQRDQPATSDCCPDDCELGFAQVQNFENIATFASISDNVTPAANIERFAGFEHRRVVFKTGPPGDPSITWATPITLKQRLLI